MRNFLLAIALCLPLGMVFAQTSGSIIGEVKDQSGAVTPNAEVVVTNSETNVMRSTTTNAAGIYSFPDLTPGMYQVKVAAAGFSTVVKTSIELQVQQTARVDFSLSLGQSTQTIEVSASAALLSTENATVGTVIEEKRISELPLNGRNFFSLVALAPNVAFGFLPAQQASGRLGGTRSTLTMSLSGARATWANYTLDGITNTDVDFNTYILLPSVEALQEFKVQSGVYPAEFGREAGQVNVSTKPGTNTYHGTAFEFLRNNVLDARAYDFSSSTRSAANPSPGSQPYRQNQYGFTLGGPIQIPKVFNGKNRLFFMSNFEGFKSRQATTSFATTMTAAMRSGDFSAIPTALQDPLTRVGTPPNVTTSPYPGNQVPQNRIDKTSLLLMKFFPVPNQPVAPGVPNRNYQYTVNTPVDKDQFNQRIDFNESANSQWFGRYSWTDELTVMPGLTTDGQTLYTRASQWVLSNVRVLSPTKVNEARFGYSSLFNNITQQLAGTEDVDAELGVPVKITDKNSWGIPNIVLGNNLTTFGNPTSSPFQINDKVYQAMDNFSWVVGKHSLRMGGEYRYNQFPQVGNEFPRGQFFFTGAFTGNPNTQSTGYAGADFLQDYITQTIIAVSLVSSDFRNNEWAAYIDDTWKIHPRLTISAGLRWEVAQPLLDVSGHSVNVQLNYNGIPSVADLPNMNQHPVYVRTGSGDFYEGINFRYQPYWTTTASGANTPGSPALQLARDGRLGNRLIAPNYKDFAPRLGIAWSPSDKWSIRAGFGFFYSQESKNSIFDLNRGLGGRTSYNPDNTYSPPQNITYSNFLNAASLPVNLPIGLTWGADHHLPTTYTMQYVLNVERQVGKSTTLEVGYNGSESRHLDNLLNPGQPIPGNAPIVTRMPYPEWGPAGIQFLKADGVGNYNGISGKVSQRFGANLTTLFSYTWSKALDDGSAIRGALDFTAQDSRCRACDYGIATFNVPHRFVASSLYTLPFGKGQRLLNRGGIVNELVGGWQLSVIATAQSGQALDTGSWDSPGTGFSVSNRLNCVAGVDPVFPNPNAHAWFNPAAFTNTVVPLFGNCARNNLIGPKQVNCDVSAIKDFRVAEKQSLQFRMEMFNAPNHVELGNPATGWGNSNVLPQATFGTITSTRASMRQIQFALKYNF
jgi:hypothetical protein